MNSRLKKDNSLKSLEISVRSSMQKLSGIAEKTEIICSSTIIAREWVSRPSNNKRPEVFAAELSKTASDNGLKVTVLDDEQMKSLGFGALLAVGQGSPSRPRLVIIYT